MHYFCINSKSIMTTFTIDIPDNANEEVITQLKKLGVKIRKPSLTKLDKLTKADFEKNFSHRAEISKNKVLKYL